jgi:hypothetical protein
LAFSPAGRTLAFTDMYRTAQLWDIGAGRKVREFGGRERVGTAGLAFSPDGKTLACGGEDEAVTLWEVASGEKRAAFHGDRRGVLSVDFAPDGRSLATGGYGPALVWDVTGLGRSRAARWQVSAEDQGPLWADLGGEDGAKAFRAVWRMAGAPEQTVPFLRQRLRSVESEIVHRLVAELDSDHFAERERAEAELKKLGGVADAALRDALSGRPSPELRHRAERLIRTKRAGDLSRGELRLLRAIEVLEHVGTPAARQLLRRLAGKAATERLRREADASLARLAKSPEPG